MSDYSAGDHEARSPLAHRTPHAEFYIYFTMIFAVAVPVALALWITDVITTRRLPVHGPFARAWREAGAITPAIFRP